MSNEIFQSMTQNMGKSIESLQKELVKVRTGRASATVLDPIRVDYYGTDTPLNQVANLTTPDAKTIQIAPWEATMLAPIEKAILAANIGLTPQNDGKLIRINMPALTEERRKEMVKQVRKMGEETKIGIRNHRRDANENVKKDEKSKSLSEDDAKKALDKIQKATDDKVKEVDLLIEKKEKEILTV